MAPIIARNPKREIIGPSVMRRKEKMSGLKDCSVVEPSIRQNPMTIMTKQMAIKIRLMGAMANDG